MIRLGVTGTDTGVGKTVVTCALAASLVRRGLRVAALKPLETGTSFDDPNRDGARLSRASRCAHPLEVTAPVTFSDPVAPFVAARNERQSIDLGRLDESVRAVSRDHDILIVEGAGGLLVPITEEASYDTLFARWSLEPIVVAANRLGVINHVRLTLAAARAAGLSPRAVVLNDLLGVAPDVSVGENASVIAELERVPVFELPWMPRLDDLEHAADLVERSGLVDLIVRPALNPLS